MDPTTVLERKTITFFSYEDGKPTLWDEDAPSRIKMLLGYTADGKLQLTEAE